VYCRYKADQQKDKDDAAEKAMLAGMTEEQRRQWELANPKASIHHTCMQ